MPKQDDYGWLRVLIIVLVILAVAMTCINADAMPDRSHAIIDHVTLVEVNHHFDDETGEIIFEQVIWYDWNQRESRYDIVDWRFLKGVRGEIDKAEAQKNWEEGLPKPDPKWLGGHATPLPLFDKWVSVWYDEKSKGVLREVHAKHFRDTWTNYDVEDAQREILPDQRRRKLRRVK